MSAEAVTARATCCGQAMIHVVGLPGDGHKRSGNHHQRDRADRCQYGIGVGPHHLAGAESLSIVIAHPAAAVGISLPGGRLDEQAIQLVLRQKPV